MIQTIEELKTVLDSTGIPVVYREYGENQAPDPPYLVFYTGDTSTFWADDEAYMIQTPATVELYTDTKDLFNEAIVEAALKDNGINYETSQVYWDDEQLNEVAYDFTLTQI